MKQSNRSARAVLLLLVLFILFASLYFVLHETRHDCTGEDCPVCRLIAICRDALKSFVLTLILSASLFASLGTFRFYRFIREKRNSLYTPVSLKDRLLN